MQRSQVIRAAAVEGITCLSGELRHSQVIKGVPAGKAYPRDGFTLPGVETIISTVPEVIKRKA